MRRLASFRGSCFASRELFEDEKSRQTQARARECGGTNDGDDHSERTYEIGQQPPIGEVPAKMNAWLIRENRFGQPTSSFQKEVVDVLSIADEVLVYVMAAGINYNNVWAALGIPVNVIKARQKAGEKEDFHIGGSDASGIVYKIGKDVKNVKVGDEVVIHCATWDRNDPWVVAGNDPMYAPSFRIWGYETNYGSFAQFTKVQAHQCMPKPKHMTWEEAASYVLVAATAWRMLHGWPEHKMRPGDPVLIWGGAGGLGSMAIQIAKASGATPVAVVSGDDKIDYCKARRQGLHRPPQVRPLGHAAALEGYRRLQQLAEGRAPSAGRSGRCWARNAAPRSSSSIPASRPSRRRCSFATPAA